MQTKKERAFRQLAARIITAAVVFMLLFSVAAMHDSAYAASSKKSKAKITYSVKVSNIDKNTAIKKGRTLKIKYRAIKKKKGKTSKAGVGFRSSNKKIATVSKKGVIKAKKKGTVKITVYCKKKPSVRKSVKIRVGTPVRSITLSGQDHLCRWRSTTFKAELNSGATNKKIRWRSDNTEVATVSSSGKVSARAEGTAVIYADAVDGSGVSGSRRVYVHVYRAGDQKWVAHRGFHDYATENTRAAFIDAGEAGFWGCECDIWETQHVTPFIRLPDIPDDPGEPLDPADEEKVEELKGTAEEIIKLDPDEMLDRENADKIMAAWDKYEKLIRTMTAAERSTVRREMIIREGGSDGVETGPDLLLELSEAYKRVYDYRHFDLVINHDQSYERVHGIDEQVWDLTDEEARLYMDEICFLDEFISVCKDYGMVPVVEIKGAAGHCITEAGIHKMAEIIVDAGGTRMLEKTYFISFDRDSLARTKKYIKDKYGVEPYYSLLINSSWESSVAAAAEEGFNAVSVKKELLNDELYDRAKGLGLGVGTWTYRNNMTDESLLHSHLQGRYRLDLVTLDYKVFRISGMGWNNS